MSDTDLLQLVMDGMGWEKKKAQAWFKTPNPLLVCELCGAEVTLKVWNDCILHKQNEELKISLREANEFWRNIGSKKVGELESQLKIAAERQKELYGVIEKLEKENIDLKAKAYAAGVAAGNERMKNNSLEKKLSEAVEVLEKIVEELNPVRTDVRTPGKTCRNMAKEFLSKIRERA